LKVECKELTYRRGIATRIFGKKFCEVEEDDEIKILFPSLNNSKTKGIRK
jgi:hypothetical protein